MDQESFEKTLHLLDNLKNGDNDALFDLMLLKNRGLIPYALNQAEIKKETDNSLYFWVLSHFNCEEYLLDIIKIGIDSNNDARKNIFCILDKLEGLNTKEIILKNLTLKYELLRSEFYVDLTKMEFLKECYNHISNIPVTESAQIIKIKKI